MSGVDRLWLLLQVKATATGSELLFLLFLQCVWTRASWALSHVVSEELWTPTLWAGLKELADGEFTVRANVFLTTRICLSSGKGKQHSYLSREGEVLSMALVFSNSFQTLKGFFFLRRVVGLNRGVKQTWVLGHRWKMLNARHAVFFHCI